MADRFVISETGPSVTELKTGRFIIEGEKPPAPPAKSSPPDTLSPIVGGIADTLGLTERPGARSALEAMVHPKGVAEHIGQAAGMGGAMTLATALGPAVGIPATAARIGASGIPTALLSATRGQMPGMETLIDMAVTALTEGAGAAVKAIPARVKFWKDEGTLGELAQKLTRSAGGLKRATEAPRAALDAIRARVGTTKLNVPSLSKTPITADQALDKLVGRTGTEGLHGFDYQQARRELVAELDRIDKQKFMVAPGGQGFVKGPGPRAGQEFASRTEKERFIYGGTPLERFARGAVSASGHPLVRSAADVAALERAYGLPAGVIAAALAAQQAGRTSRSVEHVAERAVSGN